MKALINNNHCFNDKLNKKYGKLHVLKDFSTTFESGRVTVVIGPNGSGKSTLIKCILGLVKPTSGTIFVNNNAVNGHHDYRRDIGYIPQFGHFPGNLTVIDVIKLVKNIRKDYSDNGYKGRIPFDLIKENNKKINTLSGGTRQKLSANIAFMFDPLIYICDEPTAGLDPLSSRTFKQKIAQLKAEGKTILLTSHVMSEVDEIADDIIFICDGVAKFSGSTRQLKDQTGESKLEDSVAKLMDENQ